MPIDRDEEEGLRAFAVEVEAYAGGSAPERPLRLRVRGRQLEVAAVLAQWREEERFGYRVRLHDGSSALLYYVPELDLWSGVVGDDAPLRRIVRRRKPPQQA